jgi:predicted metal-binding membrane protein
MISGTLDLPKLLQRDKVIVFVCLTLVIALSWAYVLAGAGMQMDMPGMMMARPAWDVGYSLLMFFMWWIMMVAMMLPSAAPMILLFAFLNRKNAEGAPRAVAAFISAYVVVWGGFSVIATALQWGLEGSALLSTNMISANLIFGGALLIAAGVWQLTPLKHACLRHCRAPIQFFAHGWRTGTGGAFRMGLEHGAYCLGCCWVLMALLFYGGVMNVWWIAGLAIYVLIEKVIPAGHWIGRGAGALLVVWGLGVIYPAI